MLKSLLALGRMEKLNFALLTCFLCVVFVFGGASRLDVLSQPIVRLSSVVAIAVFAVQLDRARWRAVRPSALFLGAIAATIVIQLIPLPPQLWASLPGRSLYVDALNAAGIPPVWRPLSLTPDFTINALLSVLPPMATILGLAVIGRSLHPKFAPLLLVAAAASAIVGVFQVASGHFYFYQITNEGSLVGFFANRNHEAVFLATSFPLLAYWAAAPAADQGYARLRSWTALCVGATAVPLVLVTGSRAGLILSGLGIAAAVLLTIWARRELGIRVVPRDVRSRLFLILPIAGGLVAIAATIYLSRDEAIQRLFEGAANEPREQFFPVVVALVRDYFPFGSGFGSFDTVFRSHEPHHLLSQFYVNHAHDDLLEVLLEGGIFSVLLILLFLAWYLKSAWRLWASKGDREGRMLGLVGVTIVAILLIGSVLDYPLRTPFMAVLLALACVWMQRRDVEPNRQICI